MLPPLLMAHTRGATVAWVPADAVLVRDEALRTSAALTSGRWLADVAITQMPEAEVRAAYARGDAVPWSIANAYYEADVEMRWGSYAALEGAPAVVLVVRGDAVG